MWDVFGNTGSIATATASSRVPAMGRLRQYSAAPGSPSEGDSYYDLTLHKSRTYDGTTWQNWW
jgi:hypothetical protein